MSPAGASTRASVDPSTMPSFLGSGVPLYPAISRWRPRRPGRPTGTRTRPARRRTGRDGVRCAASASFRRSGDTPMNWSSERSTTALAGAWTVISCTHAFDLGKARPAQDVPHVLVVPEGERADRALPRGREPAVAGRAPAARWRGATGSSRPPASRRRRIDRPGRSRVRMAPNAASGSSKNMTPSWLTTRSKGSVAEAPGLHVRDDELHVRRAGLRARSRANSRSGAERSRPTTRPSGATAPASAMASSPPPHPMSHTRCPGRATIASRRSA